MKRLLTIILVILISQSLYAGDSISSKPLSDDSVNPYVLHLRTNLLYDVLLVPNVGAEFGLNDNMSIVGNVMLDWLGFSGKQLYWRIFSGDVELRYWLGTDESTFLRKGHHLGVYGAFYRYDVELGTIDGQMGDFNYGGGISYGYSAPLSRSLSLDMSIGIGYMGGKYKKYKYLDGRYVWQSDEHRNYFGPTKAEVTLVWHWELPRLKSGGKVKKGGSL
ncbi:MAG: DUF3575 domain-containing protein [Prevotella sp.]|nr:DUF3575 domain-containing protein [Prevotella sp.]